MFKDKYKNYNITVYHCVPSKLEEDSYLYYTLYKEDEDYGYNSLWENLKYTTEDECVTAYGTKIDELVKQHEENIV